ncbi:MAG: hypothetical protein ACK5M3_15505 [Dysgonomonas sp.]
MRSFVPQDDRENVALIIVTYLLTWFVTLICFLLVIASRVTTKQSTKKIAAGLLRLLGSQ